MCTTQAGKDQEARYASILADALADKVRMERTRAARNRKSLMRENANNN